MINKISLIALFLAIYFVLFINCRRNKDFNSFYSELKNSKFIKEYYDFDFYNHLRSENSFSLEFNDGIRNELITVDFEMKSNWRRTYKLSKISSVYISDTIERYRLDSNIIDDKLIEEKIHSFLIECKNFGVLELSSDSICTRILFDLNQIVESSYPSYSMSTSYDKSKFTKVGVLDFVNPNMLVYYKNNAFFGPDYEYSYYDYAPVEIESHVFFYHELQKKNYD